jgi:hypothetical protein
MRFVCGTWYTGAALERELGVDRLVRGDARGARRRSEAGAVADAGQSAS